MWVLKIGGSLAGDAALRDWLLAVCAPRSPIRVVVPGGGPFADAVREAQCHAGFDDGIAHRMALLAMAQYGWQLHGLEPRLVPAPGIPALRAALARGARALWLPREDELDEAPLPRSWDLSSDSLALWLARALGAAGVALVKSIPPSGERPHHAAALAAAGYVDPCFPGLLGGADLRACWFARGEAATLRGFDGEPAAPRRILP